MFPTPPLGGNVWVVNMQPAAGISLDVNQTAVAIYKAGGVLKEDARTLQKQDVDSDCLPYLNEEVLTKMGIPTFGRRIKVLKAAQAVLAGTGAIQPMGATMSVSPPVAQVRASMSVTQPTPSPPAAVVRRQPEAAYQPEPSPPSSYAADADDDDDDEEDNDYIDPKVLEAEEKERKAAQGGGGGGDDLFATEDAGPADSFMAVKPWIGAMKEPTNPPKINLSAPSQQLAIDWVHGYRGFDSRSNLVYNALGEIVYPTAALVVIYKDKQQRYFQAHNDDIRCLAQHPTEKNLIATGQNATVVDGRSQPPSAFVWDSSNPGAKPFSMKMSRKDRAIRAVCFLADGESLVTVSNDDDHTIKLWDWRSEKLIVDERGGGKPIWGAKANPREATEFVTYGSKHLAFWTWNGRRLKDSQAKIGGKAQSFYSVAFSDGGLAVCGSKDGNAYVFKSGSLTKTIPMHPGAKLMTLESFQGGFISGGSDCTVRVWDNRLTQVVSHTFSNGVVSAVPSPDGSNLLVGTEGGDAFEIHDFMNIPPLQNDASLPESEVVTRGHGDGELWALAVARGGNNFVTAGEDNTICLWDVARHRMLKRAIITDKRGTAPKVKKASTTSSHPQNQCARGIAISPDRYTIVIGTNDGCITAFDTKTLTKKAYVDLNSYGKRNVRGQEGNWIEAISYSPTGRTIAVGTHGSVVCLLDANTFQVGGVLKASSSAITAIDWSEDGCFIQTNDLGYELLFYSVDENNLSKAKQVTSATAMRDVQWATHTCKLGWPVQGVFDPSQKGSDVNSVDVNVSKSLVVSGDDNGELKLYRYPCMKDAKSRVGTGHSSHVVTARFTLDEKYVLTTGGHDKSVIQWTLV